MSRTDLSLQEQVGLHIVKMCIASGVIGKVAWIDADILQSNYVQQATRWLCENSESLDIILHDEPMYNAAQMLGVSGKEVDFLPSDEWDRYFKLAGFITSHFTAEKPNFIYNIGVKAGEDVARYAASSLDHVMNKFREAEPFDSESSPEHPMHKI